MYRGIFYDHEKGSLVTEFGQVLVPNISAEEAFPLLSGDALQQKLEAMRANDPDFAVVGGVAYRKASTFPLEPADLTGGIPVAQVQG